MLAECILKEIDILLKVFCPSGVLHAFHGVFVNFSVRIDTLVAEFYAVNLCACCGFNGILEDLSVNAVAGIAPA